MSIHSSLMQKSPGHRVWCITSEPKYMNTQYQLNLDQFCSNLLIASHQMKCLNHLLDVDFPRKEFKINRFAGKDTAADGGTYLVV